MTIIPNISSTRLVESPLLLGKKIDGVTHPYIAGLNSKRVEIHAKTLAAAKQMAIDHFRPKKKDLGLLWVELASE